MHRAVLLLALLVPASGQSPSEVIGTIDFYGYGNLDVAALRAALPFKEGDKVPSGAGQREAVRALRKATGRKSVIEGGCCNTDGRSNIYFGLAEPDAPSIRYNPAPQGQLKLPAEAQSIFDQLDRHLQDAITRGASNEDDSQGYALIEDPATHADQLKLRAWARANVSIILQVLTESGDSEQRSNAASALGYADRSPQQIAALVAAAFDSDGGVRNAAVRALETLCTIGNEVIRQIPAERFVPLLHSIIWTDRNKGSLLLRKMTDSRDPALLKLLHDQALTPLREMARWKNEGHAWAGLMILGRIAGIEESRLDRMDAALIDQILKETRPAPDPPTSPAHE